MVVGEQIAQSVQRRGTSVGDERYANSHPWPDGDVTVSVNYIIVFIQFENFTPSLPAVLTTK